MRQEKIRLLDETLAILERGTYPLGEETVRLKLSGERMRKAKVLLPEEVAEICAREDLPRVFVFGRCGYSCENADALCLARKRYQELPYLFEGKHAKEILVLNMANPVHPGGGVRRGARAQEEDLCRNSSLLLSLESSEARAYYEYNRSLHTDLGSHGMILSPEVEILRDEQGELLPETGIVSY